ncbi:MAG TPA: hypothetical protein PLK92_01925, partial [Candidatus Paceibacterota bacterium]|nr:hypothetical protein [Candidatus Paceibacterota bacterium]HOY11434.1 hypothetical protein [Candidatus Paceibacterota bacterium]HQI26144.1 hypothetical protein [Candidatus Paceibacterota bacterium]
VNFLASVSFEQRVEFKGGVLVQEGITIMDSFTGEEYCMYIKNGQRVTVKGNCEQALTTTVSPITEVAPISVPTEAPTTTSATTSASVMPSVDISTTTPPIPEASEASTISTPPLPVTEEVEESDTTEEPSSPVAEESVISGTEEPDTEVLEIEPTEIEVFVEAGME